MLLNDPTRQLPLLGLPMFGRAAYDTLRAHSAALIHQFCCDRLRELFDERAANASELRTLRVRTKNLSLNLDRCWTVRCANADDQS
jgi:hypothetical protein